MQQGFLVHHGCRIGTLYNFYYNFDGEEEKTYLAELSDDARVADGARADVKPHPRILPVSLTPSRPYRSRIRRNSGDG